MYFVFTKYLLSLSLNKQKIMNLAEFIITTSKESFGGYSELKPRIVCNDGFSMSVQASKGNYSEPRAFSSVYSSVEIGFPSEEEPLINEYAEQSGDYTQTVYGWTPVEIVEEVILKHGGINVKETFKND